MTMIGTAIAMHDIEGFALQKTAQVPDFRQGRPDTGGIQTWQYSYTGYLRRFPIQSARCGCRQSEFTLMGQTAQQTQNIGDMATAITMVNISDQDLQNSLRQRL